MKKNFQWMLIALSGVVLLACEPNESDYVRPDTSDAQPGLPGTSAVSVGESEICSEPVMYPLLVTYEEINVGTVTIYNDGDNMYVDFQLTADIATYPSFTVGFWTGSDINAVPYYFGVPTSEAFTFKAKLEAGDQSHNFTVPLQDVPGYMSESCGEQTLYIIATAFVDMGGIEQAFAGSIVGTGSQAWWYDTYVPACCEEEEPGEERCETAFAKFDKYGDFGNGYVFAEHEKANPEDYLSIELTNNRWGWAGRFTTDGTYEFDIWGAAGLNNTNNGAKVGKLIIEVDGDDVSVTYDMFDGYGMSELHIYVSNSTPATIAPGQYGYTRSFESYQSEHMASFEVNGENDIWIIAHAVVCGEYPDITGDDFEEEEEE